MRAGETLTELAATPAPPYYAVIFTSVRSEGDNGYAEVAQATLDAAREQPGFLGFESARDSLGISVSYWADAESALAWRDNTLHRLASERARDWYREFRIRVCKVEREYGLRAQ